MSVKVIALTSGTSWTVPSDFASINFVACIGPGANGFAGPSDPSEGGGGGGFAKLTSGLPSLSPGGTVPYQVGQPGVSDTWWSDPSTVRATGGIGTIGGAGVAGDVLNTGGAGAVTSILNLAFGGGAAGDGADGGNGGGGVGGSGGGAGGGAGGSLGAGGSGTTYALTAGGSAGPGGGGGQGGGGQFGGGGGAQASGFNGSQGVIIISYNAVDTAVGSVTATAAVSGVGRSLSPAVGSITATAGASAVGRATAGATGSIAVSAALLAAGQPSILEAVGSITATSTQSADGRAIAAAAGSITAAAALATAVIAFAGGAGSITVTAGPDGGGGATVGGMGSITANGAVSAETLTVAESMGSITATAGVKGLSRPGEPPVRYPGGRARFASLQTFPFNPSATAAFTFQPRLDGILYTAVVTWNVAGVGWYMTLSTLQGVRVLTCAVTGSPDNYDQTLTPSLFTDLLVFRERYNRFEVLSDPVA